MCIAVHQLTNFIIVINHNLKNLVMKNLVSILKSVVKSESVKFNFNKNVLFRILSADKKSDMFSIRELILSTCSQEDKKFSFKASQLFTILNVLKASRNDAAVHNRLLACSNYTITATKIKDSELFDITRKYSLSNVIDACVHYLKVEQEIKNVVLKVETLTAHKETSSEKIVKLESEKIELNVKAENLKDKKEHIEFYELLVEKLANVVNSIDKNKAVIEFCENEIKALTTVK